jgi:hypothetical protein
MKKATKLRETTAYLTDHKPARDVVKAKRSARKAMKSAFKGKTFASLTSEEKDDLLKALAIRAGIIEE